MALPKLIVIVGPTASGKTDLAISVAREVDGEIIQADSRTIFREMNIGTAKPEGQKSGLSVSAEVGEKKKNILQLFQDKSYIVDGIPHWGIDIVNPDEDFTAAQFKAYAEDHIFDMLDREKVPILAGGTGLYISGVVDNLKFTDAPPNLELREELDALSNEELEHRLWKIDPESADTIDVSNRRRLLRAIEVIETTGKKLSEQGGKGKQKFDVLLIGIDVDRKELYERIDLRVDKMIAEGLVDEVRSLKEKYGCEVNAMTGIGYRQICSFLDGYMKLRDAVEVLKRDTRHYAKRQLTWFRRDDRIQWVKSKEEATRLVQEFLKQKTA